MRLAAFLAAILGFVLVSSTAANAWWNKDWQFRSKLTADASPQGGNITEPIGRTTIAKSK